MKPWNSGNSPNERVHQCQSRRFGRSSITRDHGAPGRHWCLIAQNRKPQTPQAQLQVRTLLDHHTHTHTLTPPKKKKQAKNAHTLVTCWTMTFLAHIWVPPLVPPSPPGPRARSAAPPGSAANSAIECRHVGPDEARRRVATDGGLWPASQDTHGRRGMIFTSPGLWRFTHQQSTSTASICLPGVFGASSVGSIKTRTSIPTGALVLPSLADGVTMV